MRQEIVQLTLGGDARLVGHQRAASRADVVQCLASRAPYQPNDIAAATTNSGAFCVADPGCANTFLPQRGAGSTCGRRRSCCTYWRPPEAGNQQTGSHGRLWALNLTEPGRAPAAGHRAAGGRESAATRPVSMRHRCRPTSRCRRTDRRCGDCHVVQDCLERPECPVLRRCSGPIRSRTPRCCNRRSNLRTSPCQPPRRDPHRLTRPVAAIVPAPTC